MYAKLIIVGNLGNDPEMRYTPAGIPVTNFPVAANRKYKRSDGEQVSETTWFQVSAWNRLAESTNQYLHKGSKVLVEGRLAPEIKVWTDRNGNPRAGYEVTAETIRFLTPRGDTRDNGSYEGTEFARVRTDDVPF